MSHAYGQIRFTDGTRAHVEYNGTVDVLLPNYYDTAEDVERHWRAQTWTRCLLPALHPQEEAEVAVTYGGGYTWTVPVCRACRVITGRHEPHGEDYAATDGLPDWYPR